MTDTMHINSARPDRKDTDRRLDDIVIKARKELEQLRREIDNYRVVFDSARLIVGHEFIKPLTSISGYIELIEGKLSGEDRERLEKYFQKTMKAVDRMSGLVEAFVNLLQFEEGKYEGGKLESVDVAGLVDEIKSRFPGQEERIHNEIDEHISPCILSRPCTDMILENLISNALKHGNDDTGVTISASRFRDRRSNSGREILLLRVKDNGEGIPRDRIDRMFDPFCRGEDTRNIAGTGLGLALVKSIVTVMDGDISVKSEPGEGTIVSVALSVAEEKVIS